MLISVFCRNNNDLIITSSLYNSNFKKLPFKRAVLFIIAWSKFCVW